MTTRGVIVGRVMAVQAHPHGDLIRLALVDLGRGAPVQIVFGGNENVSTDCLVPVAPPGARVPIKQRRKMRRERFRGESSHGMLCSLMELGWAISGPDEVALLRDVQVGECLDDIAIDKARGIVCESSAVERVHWADEPLEYAILVRQPQLTSP